MDTCPLQLMCNLRYHESISRKYFVIVFRFRQSTLYNWKILNDFNIWTLIIPEKKKGMKQNVLNPSMSYFLFMRLTSEFMLFNWNVSTKHIQGAVRRKLSLQRCEILDFKHLFGKLFELQQNQKNKFGFQIALKLNEIEINRMLPISICTLNYFKKT